MNDPDERFVERLATDLERVFGIGVAVESISAPAEGGRTMRVAASILFNGRIETLEAWAPNEALLYQVLMSRAVEILRAEAFAGLAGPI